MDAPVAFRKARNAVVRSFLMVTLYALLMITLYLLIELKNFSHVLLVLLSLMVSQLNDKGYLHHPRYLFQFC